MKDGEEGGREGERTQHLSRHDTSIKLLLHEFGGLPESCGDLIGFFLNGIVGSEGRKETERRKR